MLVPLPAIAGAAALPWPLRCYCRWSCRVPLVLAALLLPLLLLIHWTSPVLAGAAGAVAAIARLCRPAPAALQRR